MLVCVGESAADDDTKDFYLLIGEDTLCGKEGEGVVDNTLCDDDQNPAASVQCVQWIRTYPLRLSDPSPSTDVACCQHILRTAR